MLVDFVASTVSRIEPPALFGPLKKTYTYYTHNQLTYIYKNIHHMDALNKMDLNWIRFDADAAIR